MPNHELLGTGPTGLTLAIEMTRLGVPFRLIDKAPKQAHTLKLSWSRRAPLSKQSISNPVVFPIAEYLFLNSNQLTLGKEEIATLLGNKDRIVVVRPDGYAGFRGSSSNLDKLRDYAHQTIGIPQSKTHASL